MCCVTPNQNLPFIQPVLITHKVTETIGLAFHVIDDLLFKFANPKTYETLQDIHMSSHKMDRPLHFVCFIGDIASICQDVYYIANKDIENRGSYIEYTDKKKTKIDFLRLAGKICHTVSHFLSSVSMLSEDLKLFNLHGLSKVFKYQIVLSVVGYGIWTIGVIWRQIQKPSKDQLAGDLGIFLGGFIAESLTLSRHWKVLRPQAYLLGKIAAVAGLIHCISSIIRIMDNIAKSRNKKHDHHHKI